MWILEARCDVCGAAETIYPCHYHVGRPEHDNSQTLMCPRCFISVVFPVVVDKSCWRVWKEHATSALERQPFLRMLAETVDAAISGGHRRLAIGSLPCPKCGDPMQKGELIVPCKRCGNEGIEPVVVGHAQVKGDDPGIY